jgi:hypothetical protein
LSADRFWWQNGRCASGSRASGAAEDDVEEAVAVRYIRTGADEAIEYEAEGEAAFRLFDFDTICALGYTDTPRCSKYSSYRGSKYSPGHVEDVGQM